MRKSLKQVLTGIIIFAVTAATGFIITTVSFNLFDTMSQNQMKIIFAVDVVILLFVGTISWFICESASSNKKSRKKYIKNRQKQLDELKKQNEEILNLINCTNFAA